jgi:PGF-pre-PGF domain-containing protein
MCWVHKNGEEFVSPQSYYDGEEITVLIDTSATGTQTYSLFASDISGNEASDGVDVNVTITSSDVIAPAITNPNDVTIDQGDEERSIVWTITESNPGMCWVHKNGEEFVSQRSYYDGDEITVLIDTSATGTQTYSLFASDISGNEASDEVDVTVTITSSDTIAPAITNPTDVTIDQGDEDRSIVWTITESNPGMCWVHKNGEEFVSQRSYYDGDEITVLIDTSATGTQTYSLFASDISGNEASDEVDVTVTVTSSDTIAPAITSPRDVTIDQGNEDRNIVWTITELNPDMCRVHKNGEEFVSPRSYHDGDEITVLIDTSATGIQTYSLFASDTSTNEASDQVEITVVFSDVDGPIITNPPDVTVDLGDEGKSIVWTITESDPDMCRVHKNGKELVAPRSYYDGDEITVQIDSSATGIQTYSLFASDTSGNEANDQVEVIISDTVAPVIHSTSIEKIKIGTTGNITWIINETNPDKYWILQNNNEIVSPRTYKNGCCINVPLKPTQLGTLSYTIFANDISGNTASNQVNITVQETAPQKEYNEKQTGGSSGGGSTSEDFHNILLKEIQREFVARDEQVCYHFVSKGNIISTINFTGMRTSGIIPARVEMLNDTSSLVNYAPLDMVYKNLNIWVGNLGWANPENIANATVDFKIEKLWVTRNNINESSIRMNRYEDGKWNILVTSLIGQDTRYLYFKSEIPGFSNFVVTGKQEYIGDPGDEGIDDNKRADVINEKPMNTTTEEDTGIPGFNVIANLFILLIVVQLLRKKKDK